MKQLNEPIPDYIYPCGKNITNETPLNIISRSVIDRTARDPIIYSLFFTLKHLAERIDVLEKINEHRKATREE